MEKTIVSAKENSVIDRKGALVGTFNRGDSIVLSCNPEQKWSLHYDNFNSNANGLDVKPTSIEGISQVFNGGTLVGSIDGGNSFFPVGTECVLTITTDHTKLELFCWDTYYPDNEGQLEVVTEVGSWINN